MFCKYCGRQITDDSKFCEFCGNMIQKMESDNLERLPDIPASIGEPIFKETVFESESEVEAPMEETASQQTKRVEVPAPKPAPQPKEKKINKGLLWGLIGGGSALLIGLIVLLVVLLGGKKVSVDVTQYVDFKVSGYDGYGIATCEMDWDGLEVAVLGEYPSGSDSKTREKQIEYKENAATLRSAVTLKFEKAENVSVGDKLIATFTIDEEAAEQLGVVFSSLRRAEYTVKEKDLSGSSEIDLLEEFVSVRFEGLSGKASATLIPKERENEYSVMTASGTEYTVTVEMQDNTAIAVKFNNVQDKSTETVELSCSLNKETQLKAQDKIVLAIDEKDKDALMEYGLIISTLSAEYEVTGLEGLVEKFEQIESKTLDGWKKTYAATLQKMVKENWGYYFHGGNDIRPTVQTMENVAYKQGILTLSEEQADLYLIYSAAVADDAILTDNYGLPRTYHFAVRVSNLRVGSEGEFMSDKVLLPQNSTDDFIGAYLDYAELVTELTKGTQFVAETK